MSTESDVSMWQMVADKMWVVVSALLAVVWKQNNEKLDEHKRLSKQAIEQVQTEAALQRNHIAKIFDKMEAHSQRAEDRHRELLVALHEGLDKKADK